MSFFARMLLFVFLLAPFGAHASGDDWQVAKATSQVRYTIDQKQWTDLRAGDVVPNKAWISTGPRGRAQLVRGVESIGFQPNSMAAITTKPGGFLSPRKTEIFQQVGALDLEIEKRSQPHTTVQTPYLAAVVKGTIFHVTVGKSKASVAVDRGLVQVTSFASGQQANVGPRQSATVDRKAGMDVAGAVSKPSITSVAPSVAVVPAIGATKLSGQPDAAPDDKGKSKKGADDTSANTADDSKGKGNFWNGWKLQRYGSWRRKRQRRWKRKRRWKREWWWQGQWRWKRHWRRKRQRRRKWEWRRKWQWWWQGQWRWKWQRWWQW